MDDKPVIPRWRRLICAAAICALPLTVSGQGRSWWSDPAANPHVEQTGQFVFTRIRYGGYRSTWSHDYPRADLNLPRILGDITTIDVHLGESNVFRLDDPELFTHPIAYISEPGFWNMSESEVQGLRDYWLKGGFVIFDDFEARQWNNFAPGAPRLARPSVDRNRCYPTGLPGVLSDEETRLPTSDGAGRAELLGHF